MLYVVSESSWHWWTYLEVLVTWRLLITVDTAFERWIDWLLFAITGDTTPSSFSSFFESRTVWPYGNFCSNFFTPCARSYIFLHWIWATIFRTTAFFFQAILYSFSFILELLLLVHKSWYHQLTSWVYWMHVWAGLAVRTVVDDVAPFIVIL